MFQFCMMLEFKTLTDSYVYYFTHEYMYVNNRTKGETQVESHTSLKTVERWIEAKECTFFL